MKTLEEHNKIIYENYLKTCKNNPKPNGIACPKCHNELQDSSPNIVFQTHPPKKLIHCDHCDYTGYRLC